MSGRKPRPACARKPSKRKSKDKPKRALSAYNYFFKDERQKIYNAVSCMNNAYRKVIDPNLTEDQIKKLIKPDGKVSFEQVGKIIGARWRRISENPDRVSYYNSLAKIDAERYAKDKEKHERMNEERQYEAIRPPNYFHSSYQMPYNMHVQAPPMSTPQSSMYHGHSGRVDSNYFNHALGHEQTPFNYNYRHDVSDADGQYRSSISNPYPGSMR